jgi:hypothetical protein
MNRMPIALAFFLFSVPALSDDVCDKVSKAAMTVMHGRQDGAPMAAMMGAAQMQDSESYRALTRELVIDAYRIERRFSDELKLREVTEFGNRAYQACLESGT